MINTLKRQFLGFLFVGGIAAIVNFGSRIFIGIWVNYTTSIIIAYLLGMITAYFFFRKYIFSPQRGNIRKELFYFAIVNILGGLQTLLVSLIFALYQIVLSPKK